MTIWSELGVFLYFLYAFFFSMKSELWILASHIWPADIMDYQGTSNSLWDYTSGQHMYVSQVKKSRIEASQNLYHVTKPLILFVND